MRDSINFIFISWNSRYIIVKTIKKYSNLLEYFLKWFITDDAIILHDAIIPNRLLKNAFSAKQIDNECTFAGNIVMCIKENAIRVSYIKTDKITILFELVFLWIKRTLHNWLLILTWINYY